MGIKHATDGHSEGGGVEKVGATRGHNTPSVEASTGRRLSGSGGGVVIKLFSKSGLRGGIESEGVSLRGGNDGRRGLRGDVDSVGDAISKRGSRLSPQSQASLDQGTRVIQKVVLPVRFWT